MTMYRLIFKDGTVGGWSSDYEWVKENAIFFHAEIEERKFGA